MKKIIYLFCTFIYVFGCKEKVPSDSFDVITVDFNEALEQVRFSDLVESDITIIPLQTFDTDDEPIFLGRISKIRFTEDFIFVLGTNALFQFDKTGNYLGKIGNQGPSPFEYLQITDFIVKDDRILLLDYGRILWYSLSGDFIQAKKLVDIAPLYFGQSDQGYAFIGVQSGVNNLILTQENLEFQNSYFPYLFRAINVGIPNPLFLNFEKNLIYRRYSLDTLYSLKDFDDPEPYLFIDYGRAAVNMEQVLGTTNPEAYFSQNKSNFCITLDYLENGSIRYLSFTYLNQLWIRIESIQTGDTFLFQKENLIEDVTYDPFSTLVDMYDDYLIFSGNPARMLPGIFNQYEEPRNRQHYDKMLDLSKGLNEEANVVLFMVKPSF